MMKVRAKGTLPLPAMENTRARTRSQVLELFHHEGILPGGTIPRTRPHEGHAAAWVKRPASPHMSSMTAGVRSWPQAQRAAPSSRRASSARRETADIVIVGAGPVGVYSAILLSRFGLPCVVVDKGDGVYDLEKSMEMHPRAHVLNVRSMELLDEVGLYEPLEKEMPPLDQWKYFRYTTSLIGTEFGVIDHCDDGDGAYSNLRGSSHVFACHIAQPKLEYHLWKLARQSQGIRFLTQHEMTDIGKDGDDLVVKLCPHPPPSDAAAAGGAVDITCKYLIAADGSRSKVREVCNIGLEGKRGIESFVSIHFKCPELAGRLQGKFAMLYFVFNPKVIACIVAHDINQGEWVAQVPYFPPAQDGILRAEECHELIAAIIGAQPTGDVREGGEEGSNVSSGIAEDGRPISWKLCSWRPWSMDAMIASKYSVDGRIFLVGDAAHQFPPSGGFGLNCGLQDAHNLAWKLAAVLRCSKSASVLDSYQVERKPVARDTAMLSIENHARGLLVPSAVGLDRDMLSSMTQGLPASLLQSFSTSAKSLSQSLLQVAQSPLSLIQSFSKDPTSPPASSHNLEKMLKILLGTPMARAMQRTVIERKSIPLLFPEHDLGAKYPLNEVVRCGATESTGTGDSTSPSLGPIGKSSLPAGTRLYKPSGKPGSRLPHKFLRRVKDGRVASSSSWVSEHAVSPSVHAPQFVLFLVGSTKSIQCWVDSLGASDFLSVNLGKLALGKRAAVASTMEACIIGVTGEESPSGMSACELMVDESRGEFREVLGMQQEGAVLVRPDGYIAWRFVGSALDLKEAELRYLASVLT